MNNKTMMNRILIAMVAAAIVIGCGKSETREEKLKRLKTEQAGIASQIRELEAAAPAAKTEKAVKSRQVAITELAAAPFRYVVQTQGGVEAEENIVVSAKSPGMVTKVFVREGDQVSAGQVLAQIDNSITRKAIEELEGSLELARTVFERQRQLWDQKIGTEIQFLTAKNNKESLEKRLATLREQDDLSRIRSAISGTVDDIMVKVGENTAPGMPAARILSTRNLKVVANLSETYIQSVRAGNPVRVELADGKIAFDSKVSFAGKNINPLSRSFQVEVTVPAGSDARPGMSARIVIEFKSIAAAIAVPVNLVQSLNGQTVVYVAGQEGDEWFARKVPVQVGGIYEGRAEIISGLNAGDKVITVGYQSVNDGEPVRY
ncbi:MAG: efflux RND transporter periplasmic adaptor subunit [Bacteroidota bacterium]